MKKLVSTLRHSDIARRIMGGAFWSFTGTAIGKLCVLIAGIVCARILGKELFGQFGMIRSTINIFIVLGASGFGVTATRFISQLRQTDIPRMLSISRLTYRFAMATGFVITIGCLIFSKQIASYGLHEESLTQEIQIASLLLFFSILYGVQNGILSGMEAFKDIAKNTLIGSLLEAVFMIIGALLWGLNGAILGFGIGVIGLYVANKISIRHIFPDDKNCQTTAIKSPTDYKLLLNYSIPATLSALTVTPAFWCIRTILVKENGYDSLALFEAADQWKVMILFIPTSISQIVLPILSSSLGDDRKFHRILYVNIAIIVVVSLMIVLAVLLFGESIMNLYGKGFTDKMPLLYLAISTIFSAYSNIIEMSIYSKDKMWACFFLNLGWAIIMIVSALWLVDKGMAATGLALAVLISYAIKSVCLTLYLTCFIKK